MKKLAFLLICFPLLAKAQDCKLSHETDPYTKQPKVTTGFIFADGASVTVDADSKEVIVLFSVEGVDRCFDNTSTAAVFFEGVKSKLTIRNAGTMNCEGLFQLVFKNTTSTSIPTVLQKIMTQKINHIVFTCNNKKEATVNFSPTEQAVLNAQATCLVNEAKTIAK